MSFFSWLKGLFGGNSKPEKQEKTAPVYDDSYDDDEIVSLIGKDGEEIDFVVIAGIALNGNYYAILQPTELLEGMDDDEALVFKVTQNDNGEDSYSIELDDGVIDAVFAEYDKLLAEQG